MVVSTPFLMTMEFLNTKDLFKIAGLSKKIRAQFFSNPDILQKFIRIFVEQSRDLNEELEQKQKIIQKLDRSLAFHQQQDKSREKLFNETSGDKIKDIIRRYVVEPKLFHN